MKLPLIATASAVLAGLLCATAPAPASAATSAGASETHAVYPIKSRQLTHHKLYTTGALAPVDCPEPPLENRNARLAREYVQKIYNCLGRSWGAHFKEAGMRFSRPSLGFISKAKRFCGDSWGEAAGIYCNKSRKFVVLLDKKTLKNIDDLFLMDVVAHEYGHHLQNISGIRAAFDDEPYRNKKELNEQYRRYELQAECLSGVFIGSVWDSLDRTDEDWQLLLDIVAASGDEHSKIRDHGKGRIQKYWLSRGFEAAAPSACNTFAAPSSKVA
ncbi:neutral zinc metallopeptidase [Nonomuraea sp. NPDC050556]|uniref:neutral zinc metallopeptidase n=1 Tax=Nonomuraea sp. NPDC050556 TaxID=3364369 RepID=UPI0037B15A1F